MSEIKLKGDPIQTSGSLPAIGSKAPSFTLTKMDLSETKSTDYSGKKMRALPR